MANPEPPGDFDHYDPHYPPESIRERLWRIVFLSDTPAGRVFDITLLWLIFTCTIVVMLESVPSIRQEYALHLIIAEWVFTAIFTLEYVLRLWLVRDRRKYALSFYGIVDLLAILPTYLELLLIASDNTHYLIAIRFLRLLRMFRVMKMGAHLGEASILFNALWNSRRKIMVFFYVVFLMVTVEGTLMYVIEHEVNPDFNSIPQAIYWAIVTLTTVGFGDVVPITVPGKMLASVVMLTGYAIIAVPTGFVTVEMSREMSAKMRDSRKCGECGWEGHDFRARYCHQCGTGLG